MSDLREDLTESPCSRCAEALAERDLWKERCSEAAADRDAAQAGLFQLREAIRNHRDSVSLGTTVDDALWAVLNS